MTVFLQWLPVGALAGFLMLDYVHGARHWWTTRAWRRRAFAVTVASLALTIATAGFWGTTFAGVALLPGDRLGFAGGAVVGVLAFEFLLYWYHRALHASTWLWRGIHQMHHSAESMDAFGALYLAPQDVVLHTSLLSLVLFPVLGLQLDAGLAAAAFVGFCGVFQHANVRTPRWLGYLIQRPESHAVHHERGRHRWNYADLPLWDIAFGTFRNPATFDGKVGFYHGASRRIPEMLVGFDVAEPPASSGRAAGPGSRTALGVPSCEPATRV